jgi:hypothetical protein
MHGLCRKRPSLPYKNRLNRQDLDRVASEDMNHEENENESDEGEGKKTKTRTLIKRKRTEKD